MSFLCVGEYDDELYDGSSKAPRLRYVSKSCGLLLMLGMTAEGWGRRLVLRIIAGELLLE